MGKIIELSSYIEHRTGKLKRIKNDKTIQTVEARLIQRAINELIPPEVASRCENKFRDVEKFIDEQTEGIKDPDELLLKYSVMLIDSVSAIENFWGDFKGTGKPAKDIIPDFVVDTFFCIEARIENLYINNNMSFLELEYNEKEDGMNIDRNTADYNSNDTFVKWLQDAKKYSLCFNMALKSNDRSLLRQSYGNLNILALETGLLF